MSHSNTIAETENFVLVVDVLTRLPEPLKGTLGYAIINKKTRIVEREGTNEAEAIRTLHAGQRYYDEVKVDPKGELLAQQPDDEINFSFS